MNKYRKRPVVVYAYQYHVGMEGTDVLPFEEKDFKRVGNMTFVGLIKTLEDTEESAYYVCDGDWIVTGVHGEKWAIKDEIFKETYEEVLDGES